MTKVAFIGAGSTVFAKNLMGAKCSETNLKGKVSDAPGRS
jgi:alpha-galactosidase/6-phospho-beta-glucosidase family protein